MPISAKYKSDLQTLENCVDSGQFDRPMMEELFTIADEMAKVKPGSKDSLMLQGYLMSTLFYEASTRTRLSFESAMGRLGGGIVSTESAGEYSSAAKGETLEDTMRTVESYCDIVVLRHFQAGSAAKAAKVMRAPLINAGDGPGQHPTQALLVYTSNNACVGCCPGPSPALIKGARITFAAFAADPAWKCLSTTMSQ